MLAIKLPNPQDILFLRGDINYTEFHLVNGKMLVSSTTLLRYEEKFEGFVRVSRKHLVNPRYFLEYEKIGTSLSLKLTNNNKIKISRRRLNLVQGIIQK